MGVLRAALSFALALLLLVLQLNFAAVVALLPLVLVSYIYSSKVFFSVINKRS